MDDSFVKAPVNVPKLSGFDKSHQNLLTTKCGTITPILIDELIPGSKVNLKLALSASLPPLASDTFMRCSVKVEAFFVPFRLLAGSFESWFTDTEKRYSNFTSSSGSSMTTVAHKGLLPVIGNLSAANDATALAAMTATGGLFDYLGFKDAQTDFLDGTFAVGGISAMPPLAYHRVYHDWYRNTLVQAEVFLPPTVTQNNVGTSPSSSGPYLGCSPYLFFNNGTGTNAGPSYLVNDSRFLLLADGKYIYDLRQRNFGLDYFTTATPSPQQGSAEVVSFATSGSTGQFSIAALRAANSMQQFKERNNLAGNLFVEQCFARYGVSPSDGVAQRSLYLGSQEYEVYSKGIYQQGQDIETSGQLSGTASVGTNNPFQNTTGAQFGSAKAVGTGTLVSGFEAKEPGYLLVNATLVPRVTYSSGVHRRWTNYVGPGSLADLANPILQNVGPQPIYQYELNGSGPAALSIFGYTDRYASFKTMEDELHGLVRDGSSLEAFALQRSFAFSSTPQINSSFLEIPTNYMDQVTAVSSTLSTYGCWMDCYFDYKVAQPLAKYSLPSLQDPGYEHGRTIVLHKGGKRL